LGAVAGVAVECLAGMDTVLYDVNFDGPPHVVGAAPAFGAGPYPRVTPTSGGQIFPTGSLKIAAFSGPLVNRPVRLTAIDDTPTDPVHLGGVDLHFDLSDPQLAWHDVFHASVDVLPNDLTASTGLGIFWDAPSIHAVDFAPNGNIEIHDATGVNQVIGPYSPESVYNVRMTFDRMAATWSAAINGVPVYHGPVEDTFLKTFRIATTTGNTNLSSSAWVDNIKLTAVVPEPGTLSLAGLAASAAVLFAKRRRVRRD
jgi:hypothetical protein